MANSLGIDQSLRSTGFCIVNEENVIIHHELLRIDEKKPEWERLYHESDPIRKARISNEIAKRTVELVISYEAKRLNIEGLAFGMTQGNVTRDLAGLQMVILNELDRSKAIDPDKIDVIAPTTVKKFATGSGKSKKIELYNSLPEDVKSLFDKIKKTKGREDLVDAYWLAIFKRESYEN